MVEMTMRYENVDVAYSFILEQLYTKRPQSGPGVENEHTITATHLDTGGIAAIANGR
jgi:hypothetical protein